MKKYLLDTNAYFALLKNACDAGNSTVIDDIESFILHALTFNFKSMDAVILGTAKANSSETERNYGSGDCG